MQAQAALRKLPRDLPAFFLAAETELKSVSVEPDLWRTKEQPLLTADTGPNHTFKWEIAPKPLPPDRYTFIIQLAKAGKLESVQEYGANPYAIVEWSEMLTGAFRRWRRAPEETPVERAEKRQLERNIIFIAGVAAHWATDGSNPMHASIHTSGWSPRVPNPNGYEGKELHRRYESVHVEMDIQPDEVERRVPAEARLLGDWLREAESYIEANNRHVEQIYIWDKTNPFGSDHEAPEAKAFTAARLADGARMTRDIWYSAWVKSGM